MGFEDNDDLFDFSEQIFEEPSLQSKNEHITDYNVSEVQTSFILVNALLNLLIKKGLIYPHEVNALVEELYSQYIKKRGNM